MSELGQSPPLGTLIHKGGILGAMELWDHNLAAKLFCKLYNLPPNMYTIPEDPENPNLTVGEAIRASLNNSANNDSAQAAARASVCAAK